MRLSLYQALDGDCIWLRFGGDKKYNVLIDVGYLENYKYTLRKEITEIRKNNELVDLLVITHNDEDHISGFKGLFNEKEITKLISEVWFNTASKFKLSNINNNTISFEDGNDVAKFLIENNIKYKPDIINEIDTFEFLESKITILSPKKDNLKEYIEKWDEYNKSHNISSPIRDWGETIDDLAKKPYVTDTSLSNRVSISFLLEYNCNKILFLGDSNHAVIARKLKDLGYSNKNPLKVNYIKLAHHGSKYNTSNKLIGMIECNNYIISSNGNNLYKETLARILKNPNRKLENKIIFYFNYPKECYKDLFCESDFEKYNFICRYADRYNEPINIDI